ncbi:hypothetical protein KR222_004902 [Zaprionus bogoriensis]|nr:hypothetical protein KR222_004902 [Zaprionus bogoriensis]
MSYLLTEIALEMLGYKFYDTNGVFHLTNFQQSVAAAQADVHPDEPPLIDFIDQPPSTEPEQNGHVNGSMSSVEAQQTPARSLVKVVEPKSEKIPNGQEQQQPKQQEPSPSAQAAAAAAAAPTAKISTQPRRTPARALAKILDYESHNIRNQISQRLEVAFRKSSPLNKEQQLRISLNEQRRILKDAKNMQEFRQFLEERLQRIDPRPYETYVKTFGVEQT